MENMKNLCGKIPESLHKRVLEDKEPDITNGEYLTKVLTDYFARLDGQTDSRTLGCQISEKLHQRLDEYLNSRAESGKKLSQKSFVLGLIEKELARWDAGEDTELRKDMKSGGKGYPLAYRVSAELFQHIEQYLDAHRGLSKKGLIAGVILRELDAWATENDSVEGVSDIQEEVETVDTQFDIPTISASENPREDAKLETTA